MKSITNTIIQILIVLMLPITVGAVENTISISSIHASVGENITFQIYAKSVTNIAGVQANLDFDPTIIKVISVTQGNLFDPYPAFVGFGTIDNKNGTVNNMYSMILGANSIKTNGIFINIQAIALKKGKSSLILNKTLFALPDGSVFVPKIQNGDIKVNSKGDKIK